ncbi:hypothetical protein [Hymenobacter lucidus]|uniref:Uncharacterized protein n=1 Tax=Hymenobacter lucidus TaxID=2880930 RepID=A0ABS8AXF3_9BACT|nr:hypothetical protein [Hymenobacter lucidus]MCB2410500.1 hypothetical protein [Hymenobacter lucidus]
MRIIIELDTKDQPAAQLLPATDADLMLAVPGPTSTAGATNAGPAPDLATLQPGVANGATGYNDPNGAGGSGLPLAEAAAEVMSAGSAPSFSVN